MNENCTFLPLWSWYFSDKDRDEQDDQHGISCKTMRGHMSERSGGKEVPEVARNKQAHYNLDCDGSDGANLNLSTEETEAG